jgi:hypothetical protein
LRAGGSQTAVLAEKYIRSTISHSEATIPLGDCSESQRMRVFGQDRGPQSIQSIWQRAEEGIGAPLRIDVFECILRNDARESLVRVLGKFESPEMARQEQTTIGDEGFAAPEDTAILFARGNIMLLMRNAGRDLVPISKIARWFNRDLVSRPETEGVKVVPEIRRFHTTAPELQVGASAPLEVEAADPQHRPLWYKFFSRHGEVLLEEGSLVYRSGSFGPQGVMVSAMNANRGAASQELLLNVK